MEHNLFCPSVQGTLQGLHLRTMMVNQNLIWILVNILLFRRVLLVLHQDRNTYWTGFIPPAELNTQDSSAVKGAYEHAPLKISDPFLCF